MISVYLLLDSLIFSILGLFLHSSLRRGQRVLIFSNIYWDWETFGKHLEHVLHILLPCANRLISILCYCPFYFLGLILIASHAF